MIVTYLLQLEQNYLYKSWSRKTCNVIIFNILIWLLPAQGHPKYVNGHESTKLIRDLYANFDTCS